MSCDCKQSKGAGHYCKRGERETYQARLLPSFQLAGDGYNSPDEWTLQPSALLMRDAKGSCGDGRSCSWWWITVHPKTVQRIDLTGDNFYDPLSEDEIDRSPAARVCSTLKVRITLSDQTWKQRILIVDVGAGFSFSWYGNAVKIEVLVSSPKELEDDFSYAIRKTSGRPIKAQGPLLGLGVEDTILEANALALDYPRGGGLTVPLMLTQTQARVQPLEIPFPAHRVFQRPPGARRVAIYSNRSTTWAFSLSPGAAGIGPLPSNLNVGDLYNGVGPILHTNAGQPVDVPGPACALVVSDGNWGFYSVIWEVIP